MVKKNKKYTNVVSERPFGSSWIGETTNNQAGFNVVDKEVVKGLKSIKADTQKESYKNMALSVVPFGSTYSIASGLARDYKEGDLTKENWLTKTMIHSNPSLNTKEYANDELNQFKGALVSDIRNSNEQNQNFFDSSVDPYLRMSLTDDGKKAQDFNMMLYDKGVENTKSKINDLNKIDKSKVKEFENITKTYDEKNQERLAYWRSTSPEERRVFDGAKRYDVNPNLDVDDPLNYRAIGEGNVVPDLNDIDKKYLPDDYITGANIHKDIGEENLKKLQDPNNVDKNNKIKPEAKINTASSKYNNIGSEQFGDGTKNTLGLGAGASATGLGIFLNQYWLAILGGLILLGIIIYLLFKDKNKSKSRRKTYSKHKSTSKHKKSSQNGSNPINIFVGDVKQSSKDLDISKISKKVVGSNG